LENQEFYSCKEIRKQGQGIKKFFARNFTKNNEQKAMFELCYKDLNIRRKDIILISFFSGVTSITLFFLIWFISISDHLLGKEDESFQQLCSSIYTFRLLFIFIFMIAACGVVLQVLHRYRINYVSIFEIEIKHKVTYMKLYRVSSMGF